MYLLDGTSPLCVHWCGMSYEINLANRRKKASLEQYI